MFGVYVWVCVGLCWFGLCGTLLVGVYFSVAC